MQKTAYEMRIIDCSSDVCSSDLGAPDGAVAVRARDRRRGELWLFAWRRADGRQRLLAQGPGSYRGRAERHRRGAALSAGFLSDQSPSRIATDRAWAGRPSARARSEGSRVGKECVRTGRYRWEPDNEKKNKQHK